MSNAKKLNKKSLALSELVEAQKPVVEAQKPLEAQKPDVEANPVVEVQKPVEAQKLPKKTGTKTQRGQNHNK